MSNLGGMANSKQKVYLIRYLIRTEYHVMIVSFNCKETESIWQGRTSRKLPVDIQDRALRKMRQLHVAQTLEDLRNPPSNYLESLRGDRQGQMSIRINKQWRLCFIWDNAKAWDVEIKDYH